MLLKDWTLDRTGPGQTGPGFQQPAETLDPLLLCRNNCCVCEDPAPPPGGAGALSALCRQHASDHVTTKRHRGCLFPPSTQMHHSLCPRRGGVPEGCLDDRCSSLDQPVVTAVVQGRMFLQFYSENPNRKSCFYRAEVKKLK
ncbi:hypothetical protein OJAV_G00083820 [Oryzias javanicus]|uniref:Uncharacterized protein n=1 Tax=Oryzias javanicus TaxID=123683 RepID=A0A3S2M8F9_ORYJA|nr:hypothetical protein OJAV_G00083820 [Oryzias javanicus]